jgi:hypothetical protein
MGKLKYGKIVIKEKLTGRKLSETIVMPDAILNIAYLKLLIGEASGILNRFSDIVIEECDESKFNPENLLLYLRLENGEIDSDYYQLNIK